MNRFQLKNMIENGVFLSPKSTTIITVLVSSCHFVRVSPDKMDKLNQAETIKTLLFPMGLVTVMIGLIRAFNFNTNVIRLFLRQHG